MPSWDTPLPFDPISEGRRKWIDEGWADGSDGIAIVGSVIRVEQIWLSSIEATLRPLGLTFARYEALMVLYFSQTGSLKLGKLRERLQVHPASVTNAIDRLATDGFVTRRANIDDGRSTLAEIQPRGRQLALRATKALREGPFSQLELTPEELELLFQLLRKVRVAACDFAEPDAPQEEEEEEEGRNGREAPAVRPVQARSRRRVANR